MTPRFWDTMMLRDELDMLHVRLAEAENWPVYRHVIVEARQNHRGDPKPLHYAENRERFAPWADRIIHVAADFPDLPGSCPECGRDGVAWAREHYQRNRIWKALEEAGAEDGDAVNLADVDEFPPAGAFTEEPAPVLAHNQRLMMYAVDWEHARQSPTLCSVTTRYGWAKGRDATAIRDTRNHWRQVTGGFHLTWLGGVEGQRAKLSATCHTEMTSEEYDRIWSGACYERGAHHSGEHQMLPVDVDETWPRSIYERNCPPEWFRPR